MYSEMELPTNCDNGQKGDAIIVFIFVWIKHMFVNR